VSVACRKIRIIVVRNDGCHNVGTNIFHVQRRERDDSAQVISAGKLNPQVISANEACC
jgi:hypothetical protein